MAILGNAPPIAPPDVLGSGFLAASAGFLRGSAGLVADVGMAEFHRFVTSCLGGPEFLQCKALQFHFKGFDMSKVMQTGLHLADGGTDAFQLAAALASGSGISSFLHAL